MNYSFDNLNDKEFEILCRDLLSMHLGLNLRSFKSGRDRGIDIRYSSHNNNEIVIQAKHYIKTPTKRLISDLKNIELPKVEKLKPNRYIIVTSKELSVTEVDEIKEKLSPWIRSSLDIFHRATLNSILSDFPNIEKKHFKLWLSSTQVISNILHNQSRLVNQYFIEELAEKISLYVRCEQHLKAEEILRSQSVLLITGPPGVGKSTLAEILIYKYLNEGYEVLKVENDIKEAENLLNIDPQKQQIIFFDDFLGANFQEIYNVRNSESKIVGLISRIRNAPNKFLVLTSRTTILNSGIQRFEKLARTYLKKRSQFQIELSQYSEYEKALILYNHLYHRFAPDFRFLDYIRHEKIYHKIINHPNYFPRLVEYTTDPNIIEEYLGDRFKYIEFVFNTLDNPSEVWKRPFHNQLNTIDQLLLISLFTLGGNAETSHLKTVLKRRIEFEIKHGNIQYESDYFYSSVERMLGGYIHQEIKVGESEIKRISFINPSLGDFLLEYLLKNDEEIERILETAIFFDQITNISSSKIGSLVFSRYKIKAIQLIFSSDIDKIRGWDNKGIDTLYFVKDKLDQTDYEEELSQLSNQIEIYNLSNNEIFKLIKIVLSHKKNSPLSKLIQNDFMDFFTWVCSDSLDSEELNIVQLAFEKYDEDFQLFISNDEVNESIRQSYIEEITQSISVYFDENYTDFEFELQTEIDYEDETPIEEFAGFELKTDIEDLAEDLFQNQWDELFTISPNVLNISLYDLTLDFDDIKNNLEDLYEQYDTRKLKSEYRENWHGNASVVDLLFEK